ncbi:30S ribosomal protein S18 [Sulfurimonas sp. HSL-1656]|jgi:small subunit ribosomal protein S18|uniref:Small ribosomal subunit protein bS18 n=1 Tax=Sulfurimonas diazotrophicus TaxID=3131939 RepID=A0ABZ3HCD2_9BACT|nr:30S ribosomal protein S18 [Sulfurimonas sp. HSL-3221]UFS63171.1 30S ribosomal protein S18 [Sulfurimonas sp. HSL-3221]
MAEKRKYKKRYCKYCEAKVDFIDYKDASSLKHSLSERYKIMPRRLTGNCKRHQDMVTIAIKRARSAAIIPYTISRKEVVVNPFEIIK